MTLWGLWAAVRSPLGRYVVLALACVLVLLFANRCGYASGVRAERAKDDRAQAAAAAKVKSLNERLAALGVKSRTDLAAAQAAVQIRTETLIRKVPVYVTSKADAACVVPAGFVSLWNRGASGQTGLPAATRGSVDAPSGLPLSAILAADLDNDGVAYGWKAEALTWRDWYAKAKTDWDRR